VIFFVSPTTVGVRTDPRFRVGGQADRAADDRELLATFIAALEQTDGILGAEVVEDAETKHNVEAAQLTGANIAHVVLHKGGPIEAQNFSGESSLLDMLPPTFDPDNGRAVASELDGISTFVAAEIEDAQLIQRLTGEIGNDLSERVNQELWGADLTGLDRMHPMAEVDVVRDPWTEFGDDRVSPGLKGSRRVVHCT
jgi:hypothetical protein